MTEKGASRDRLIERIQELEIRLEESNQLVNAIKSGEVDAFAINNNSNAESEIFTLQSGDHAFRVLIEEIGEGALNVTEEGIISFANPHLIKLFNKSRDKIVGNSLFEFIHPDSREKFRHMFRNALKGQAKGEVFLRVGDEKRPALVSMTSLQPKLSTIGIIMTDLTDFKNKEKLILQYQQNLKLKNKELSTTNKELASFVYIASHDLQEPLRKIQTFISRLEDKETSNLSSRGEDYFQRITQAATRMQNLIEDLLDYSRASNENKVYVKTDMNEIVNEVLNDLHVLIEKAGAEIEVGELCEAEVIPFQFKQLILNLVSNSLKFTVPGRKPRITIESKIYSERPNGLRKLPKKDNYCHLVISDNGVGFSQKYSDKLFELFQRLHSRDEYEGTGIGLAIVKKIVENHHGMVSAEGKLGEGATFNIWFPTN
ncbi:sensor histidine kinase [Zeaxanthinibacter enoshimensis]|uniref:histidine kinase n=1 Tax=Zeaxanthinibacter enoshimensis TaxID=392009 RepID=A0A4R6TG25_9FLAO|nr:ATP-binding protein [Zeaxanthinibacter enoshimensis]TDQ29305.1 PAS domain S-box-containing protein [Zeaxanthinibacter enoshimensis]